MIKLISILLLCIYNIPSLYSQGFNIYALNKYSGGLTNEQNGKINMALWYKENADEKGKDIIKNSKKIKLLQSQNKKESKIEKLAKKQERLLAFELDNLEGANELYHEVYIEILKSIKKKTKNQSEAYDIVQNLEKEGEQLFKEGKGLLKNIDNIQELKKQNEIKQKAVEKETKGLEVLLLAMEGYFDLSQNIDSAIVMQKFMSRDSINFAGTELGENEIIVISKDALIHYNDRPEIYELIINNYNVDTIESFVSIPLYQLRNKQAEKSKFEVKANNIITSDEQYEKTITDNPKSDTVYFENPIKENIDNVSVIQRITESSQNKPKAVNTVKNGSIQTGHSTKEYYVVQILARKTPLPKNQLELYYPGIQNIKMKQEEGWYKYQVGRFINIDEAIRLCNQLKLNNSFVAKYNGEKRISIVYVFKNKT